jgi:hypothetical protein
LLWDLVKQKEKWICLFCRRRVSLSGLQLSSSLYQVQFSLVERLGHLESWANFLKNNHRRNFNLFCKLMIVHNKIMVLMQARYFVHKLIPSSWEYEPACSVCKTIIQPCH